MKKIKARFADLKERYQKFLQDRNYAGIKSLETEISSLLAKCEKFLNQTTDEEKRLDQEAFISEITAFLIDVKNIINLKHEDCKMSDETQFQSEAIKELNLKYATEADKLITEGMHCLTLSEKSNLKKIVDQVSNVFKKWDELIKEFKDIVPEEYSQMKFVFNKLQNEYKDMKEETVKEEVSSETVEDLEKELEAEEAADPDFVPIEEKGFFSRNWGWIAGGAAALAVAGAAAYYLFNDDK